MQPKGRGNRRFAYKDKTARDGFGVYGHGLYKVGTRFRQFGGVESYTFRIKARSHDFANATEAEMTMQIYGVAGVGVLTAEWTATKRGWKLRLSNFE